MLQHNSEFLVYLHMILTVLIIIVFILQCSIVNLECNSQNAHGYHDSDPAPHPIVLRSRPVLSKKAIHIMETWYHDNINHPYPNHTIVHHMAQQTGLKAEQIKKWFGNKRNRCKNARPYKKQKKLTVTHVQHIL